MFVGEHVDSAWRRRRAAPIRHHTRPRWLLPVPFLAAAVIIVAGIMATRGQIELVDEFPYPDAAVALLAASGVHGNLATDFNWGEYLIWQVGPAWQVSIDGRRETVYAPETYEQNLRLRFGLGTWDDLLIEHPTVAALLVRGSAADNLLRQYPGWLLVYHDEISVLFVNQQSPIAAPLQQIASDFKAPPPQKYFPDHRYK